DGPITNCTIADNLAGIRGGGISGGEIINCIIWDNWPEQIYLPASVTYSDVQGGWEGEGNIDADPLFALDTDYHLMPGSPCIDAGTNDPCGGLPTTDIEGVVRPLDGDGDTNAVADMGAYEYCPNSPSIAVSALSFYFRQDWPKPDPKTLQIRNCGDQPLHWEIIEDCNWLKVAPANGVSTDQVNEVTITVDPNGLAPGLYNYDFKVQDPNASNNPVTIRVIMPVGIVLRVPSQNYPTIQAAIDAAGYYDVVVVADGNYTGPGNKNLDFGGKAITVCSENGPNNCIIDCENSGCGFDFQNGETENSIVDGFTITNGGYGGIYCEDSSPTIKNCTISNNTIGIYGYGGSCPAISNCSISENSGCGIYYYPSHGPDTIIATIANCTISNNTGGGISCIHGILTITNCIISGNSAENHHDAGGGIYCGYGSVLTITNSTITSNSAGYNNGGGIFCRGDLKITNCIITGNSAESGGGGVECENATITNSNISNNTGGWGGGIYCYDGSTTITNCTINGNSARWIGGIFSNAGSLTVTNCTITGNTENEGYGGGINIYDSTNSMITNCILWGNKSTNGHEIYIGERAQNTSVSYTDVQGGQADIYVEPGSELNWGPGNIDAEPCFVEPGFWEPNGTPGDANDDFWIEGDYHLLKDSSCIDAGDPNFIPEPDETDLDGNPRIIGDYVDMGAYEY
ncbi:MAG: right-handed parallel beta-helix repeat-containing protein, partial [Planctomycetota bacterium]